jgi:hypothetical protein
MGVAFLSDLGTLSTSARMSAARMHHDPSLHPSSECDVVDATQSQSAASGRASAELNEQERPLSEGDAQQSQIELNEEFNPEDEILDSLGHYQINADNTVCSVGPGAQICAGHSAIGVGVANKRNQGDVNTNSHQHYRSAVLPPRARSPDPPTADDDVSDTNADHGARIKSRSPSAQVRTVSFTRTISPTNLILFNRHSRLVRPVCLVAPSASETNPGSHLLRSSQWSRSNRGLPSRLLEPSHSRSLLLAP